MRAHLPKYELHTPKDIDDALALLADEPGTWTPLAGGTDVMVRLAAGHLPPGKFLSIWGLDELRGITVDDDFITLGALTTYTEVQRNDILRTQYPMLALAAGESGAHAIQNRGTLGGNIANGSPAADSPPALLAYDAEIELTSRDGGSRWIAYDGFHTGYKQMTKKPEELLRAIRMPRKPGGTDAVHYYRKVGTRSAQAISKVVVAGLGALENGVVAHVRFAIGSVAPTVLRCKATETVLTGHPLDAKHVVAARDALMTEIAPIDDIRSTKDYRTEVSGNLLDDFLIRLSRSGSNLPAPT